MRLMYIGAIIGLLVACICTYYDIHFLVAEENWNLQFSVAITFFAFTGDLADNHQNV